MKWNNKRKLYAVGGAVAGVLVIAIILAIALGSCGAGKYDKLFADGEKAYDAGDYASAIKKLEKAVAASPEEEAYLLLADAYVKNGDSDMAIQVLYLGYSKTGSDAIAQRLDELKNSANGISPSDGAAVDIAGTSSHHKPFQRSKTHGSIHTFAVFHRTNGRAIAQMAYDNFGIFRIQTKIFDGFF